MENKYRLIISVVLMFVVLFLYFSTLNFFEETRWLTVSINFVFILISIWALTEGIIFVKRRENRDALPLGLMAISISIFGAIWGIGSISGGVLSDSTALFLLSAIGIILPLLGIWAIINGIILIKNKTNVGLGVASLIIGIFCLLVGLL